MAASQALVCLGVDAAGAVGVSGGSRDAAPVLSCIAMPGGGQTDLRNQLPTSQAGWPEFCASRVGPFSTLTDTEIERGARRECKV